MFDEILIFSALGILAGLLAGMFGIGGGLIIVPVLIGTFASLGFDNEVIVHLSIGTAIACIILQGFPLPMRIIIKILLILSILSLWL